MSTEHDQKLRAMLELGTAIDSVRNEDIDDLAQRIQDANTVVCYGAGREGLVMRGLTMRLFHAGLSVSYVADMTCPALGPGDLLLVSLGPGRLRSVETFAAIAREAGATVACFTAQPDAVPRPLFDLVFAIRAQTMASDRSSDAVLPMGSAFEIALSVVVDLLTNQVRRRRGEDAAVMRGRHTNLE